MSPSESQEPSAEPGSTPEKLIEERRQYAAGTLRRSELAAAPVTQFENWLADARSAKLIDATAMAISTVGADQQPHTRMVLLKHFDKDGFVWYTDQSSAKAQQLDSNSKACILFFWRELERQVRIEGSVMKLDAASADEYFYSRPEGSRFSAAASNQSSVVKDRSVLENRVAELQNEYPDGNVPRPTHWGGFRLSPSYFEFWQGRNDRLHDRFAYSLGSDNSWQTDRLSP